MATISSTHYLLSTSSKQRNKCSRIELKMTETETKQLQRSVSTFAMQLALRLCFCQMPNASITKVVSSETLKCSGGVTRQIHPHRRSGDTTTPNRRMEPDQGYGPLPRCPKLTVDERAPQSFTGLRSLQGASHHPRLCHLRHLRRGLSSERLSPNLRCWLVQLGLCFPSL